MVTRFVSIIYKFGIRPEGIFIMEYFHGSGGDTFSYSSNKESKSMKGRGEIFLKLRAHSGTRLKQVM